MATQMQIAQQSLAEQKRHNEIQEHLESMENKRKFLADRETARANVAKEAQGMLTIGETRRSNLAKEDIANRDLGLKGAKIAVDAATGLLKLI